MNPFLEHRIHRAHRAFGRVIAASVLTVASTHLVQAQQQQPVATPQSSGTTTHAAKKAELKKLEQNGYQPSATDSKYPQDIQNAEKKANGAGGANQAKTQ
jgi:hypothetical protein